MESSSEGVRSKLVTLLLLLRSSLEMHFARHPRRRKPLLLSAAAARSAQINFQQVGQQRQQPSQVLEPDHSKQSAYVLVHTTNITCSFFQYCHCSLRRRRRRRRHHWGRYRNPPYVRSKDPKYPKLHRKLGLGIGWLCLCIQWSFSLKISVPL